MKLDHHQGEVRLRILFGGFVALVVVFLFYCLIERELGSKHLQQVRRTLKNEGLLRSRFSIVPPPSEEEIENGQRLFDLIELPPQNRETYPEVQFDPDTMQLVDSGVAISGVSGPTPLSPKEEQGNMPADWVALHKQVSANSELLKKAMELLRKPITVDRSSIKAKDPIGRSIRLLTWLNASAVLKLHDGDIAGAIDDLANVQQVAVLVGRPNSVVDHSLEWEMWQKPLFGVVWEVLQTGAATDQDLVRLSGIVSRRNFVEGGVLALQVEMAGLSEAAFWVDKDKSGSLGLPHPPGVFALRPVVWVRDFLWPSLWKKRDLAGTLLDGGENIRLGHDLLEKRNWQAKTRKPKTSPFPYDRWRFPLRDALSLSADSILLGSVRSETQRQMLIAAIALERYRLKHGAYPETLDALKPDFVKTVPHDWFDGQPLKYRRLAPDAFRLYSVNEDGIDNGGDPKPTLSSAPLNLFSGRDAVWPQMQK